MKADEQRQAFGFLKSVRNKKITDGKMLMAYVGSTPLRDRVFLTRPKTVSEGGFIWDCRNCFSHRPIQ